MALLRKSIQSAVSFNYTNSFAGIFIGTPPIRTIKRWVSPTLHIIKLRKDKLGREPLQNRTNFLEWNYTSELFAFGKRLNETFDSTLLQQAFTNRSYIVQEELKQQEVGIEQPNTNLNDNKKLIETGGQLISEYVYVFLAIHLPKFPQDGIKAVHDWLLSDEVLANVSSHIGAKELILTAEFPPDPSTLADTFKAIVGALANSNGQNRAYDFIRDFVCTQLNQKDINDMWTIDNPITLLQSICSEQKLGDPEPRLIGTAGKNTLLAVQHVGIYCNKKLLAEGFGENVDTAIEVATRHSLAKLFGTHNLPPFNYKISAIECFDACRKQTKTKLIDKV